MTLDGGSQRLRRSFLAPRHTHMHIIYNPPMGFEENYRHYWLNRKSTLLRSGMEANLEDGMNIDELNGVN